MDAAVEDVDAAASVSLAGWPAWATILPRFEAIRPPEVCRPSTGMALRIAAAEKAQTNKQTKVPFLRATIMITLILVASSWFSQSIQDAKGYSRGIYR